MRKFHAGMGQAVAERTYLRKKENGKWENWADVANRVALGNSLLCKTSEEKDEEFQKLKNHIGNATVLMSGRHLQHGDESQPNSTMELFTNCACTSTSFTTFLLLMSGCFSKGTLVKMGDGSLKPIEEIVIGDEIYSYDKENKKFVIEIVEKVYMNNPKPMVEIELENDEIIRCTADHKFLTKNNGWIEAKDLYGMDILCYE